MKMVEAIDKVQVYDPRRGVTYINRPVIYYRENGRSQHMYVGPTLYNKVLAHATDADYRDGDYVSFAEAIPWDQIG